MMNATQFLSATKPATKSRPVSYPGLVLWEGPSAFDGSPLALILTGFRGSSNSKTGSMLQTYIIRQDVKPTEAKRLGLDGATCGTCPFRSKASGGCNACYVNCGQGPRMVFETYKRGGYAKLGVDVLSSALGDIVRGREVRFGTYGDPLATDRAFLFGWIAHNAKRTTGYTHSWRGASLPWKGFLMASCDSPEDVAEATAEGWRTFRIRLDSEPLLANEIACPASKEGGEEVQCTKCGLCNGAQSSARLVAIMAHGSMAGAYAKWRADRSL
jgi:hypothetical protein